MHPDLFKTWEDALRCPFDRSALRATPGSLCCHSCGRAYPIEDGIVRFIGTEQGASLDDERKVKEMCARDAAAQTYDADFVCDELLYFPAVLRSLRLSPQDTLGDLGCGTGRLSLQCLGRVRRVIGVDFSLESLKLFQRLIPQGLRERVLLLQADLCHLPLAAGILTSAVSSGVLEHIPTPAQRAAAMAATAELLAPGAALTCTVYNWSRRKQRNSAAGIGDDALKEGFHSTGIYYYNFDPSEFRGLLTAAAMHVETMQGLVVPVRGARVMGRLIVPLNRLLARTQFGIQRAQFLLARARVRAAGAAAA